MENKDRMFTGDLYLPNDTAITEEQNACLELLYTFNQTRPSEQEKRNQLLKQMFAEIGENCYIEPPFHANFGGKHVMTDIFMLVITRCLHQVSLLQRLDIQFFRNFEKLSINIICLFTSGKIAGLEQVQLFCRALPLATKSSLVQAVLSRKTCRPTW